MEKFGPSLNVEAQHTCYGACHEHLIERRGGGEQDVAEEHHNLTKEKRALRAVSVRHPPLRAPIIK